MSINQRISHVLSMPILLPYPFIGLVMKPVLSVVRNFNSILDYHSFIDYSIGEKSFFIPRLTSDHSGMYTCIVENSVGRVNQSIYLNVQCKSRRENEIFFKIDFQMHHEFELLNLVLLSIVLIPSFYNVLSMLIRQFMQ